VLKRAACARRKFGAPVPADLERADKGVQRIFGHTDIYDAVADRLAKRVAEPRVGDPLKGETDVGPLILPKEVARAASSVEEATRTGARVAAAGQAASKTTYQPTVLLEPAPNAKVRCEELFGPVACLYRFADLDQAVSMPNSLPLAFQASVFTAKLDVALRVADHIDAATVMVNDHTAFRTDWMPFAGRRHSGYGIGGIGYTMHELTQHKMIVFKGEEQDVRCHMAAGSNLLAFMKPTRKEDIELIIYRSLTGRRR
jgi:acyl-CoA reductase-like NAD-dependent aldehyde dehydrogenase